MIIDSYYNDELILVVIHGKQGYGKSTYASIILSQVYGYIKTHPRRNVNHEIKEYKYDWDDAKEYFVFQPHDFLTLSRKQNGKSPGCVIDDAGMWLNSMDFNHPLVKATGKFLEVARTKWGAILFTCSDLSQVFSKIRNMPHVYTIRIIKQSGGRDKPDRRIATIFEGWRSEDLKKSGRKTKYIDMFYARMPDSFYSWYKPERDRLADMGLDELETELNKLNI
jgi:hypothetical protein